jgi:secreted protein with Ig-like and vWFA domain
MMLTLVPRFRLDHVPTQEYIFLIDRSGSMAGSRIDQAKQALVLFLQSLPKDGTFFNIFSFGTNCSWLWSASQKYTDSARVIAVYSSILAQNLLLTTLSL